jgi:hypothetical protein
VFEFPSDSENENDLAAEFGRGVSAAPGTIYETD